MARNSKKVSTDGRTKEVKGFGNFKGFIQHNLSAEEKKAFQEWVISGDDLWGWIDRLIDSSFKLSVSYDGYNKTCQASLTCNDEKSEDFGWVLVARAPDAYSVILLVLYKHTVLLSESWLDFHERAGVEDRSWG